MGGILLWHTSSKHITPISSGEVLGASFFSMEIFVMDDFHPRRKDSHSQEIMMY
jgi:hypothetical protein